MGQINLPTYEQVVDVLDKLENISVIKSIQRGTKFMANNVGDSNVTINPIDITKSVIYVNSNNNNGSGGRIVNTNTINLSRTPNGTEANLNWQVVEYK